MKIAVKTREVGELGDAAGDRPAGGPGPIEKRWPGRIGQSVEDVLRRDQIASCHEQERRNQPGVARIDAIV